MEMRVGMEMRVNPEYQALLPQLPKEEYEALKASIKEEGLHFPLTVNREGVILDGHHRWRACQELGLEVRSDIKDFNDPLLEKRFVIEANLKRRHLNDYQRAELATALEPIERELAKRRMSEAGKVGRQGQLGVGSNGPPPGEGRAEDLVAKKVGLSRTTYRRAKKVMVKGSEKLKESVRKGKKSIASAYKAVTEAEKPPSLGILKRKFDVWSIAEKDLEKPFGDPEYPGAIPGDIVGNVLLWFLPKGGKVVDPMAGGGVTEDVCKALGQHYTPLLYDNFSIKDYKYRGSIMFNNIAKGTLPPEAQGVDLLFADPPYGPLKEYGAPPEELYQIIRGLAEASLQALNPGGVVAVLMQNYYMEGECMGDLIPLINDTSAIFKDVGFKQIFEATVPLYGKVARSDDHMTHIDRRLLVFRRD